MGFRQKTSIIGSILSFTLRTYPVRMYRVLKHVVPVRYKLGGEIAFLLLVFEWLASLFLYITDLFLFPEIICIASLIFTNKLRGLTPKEKEIQHMLFQHKLSIPILINNKASLLTNKGKYAFVSFYIINSDGPINDRTFAHELIHIYQFARYGSPYIIRALLAQHTPSGYGYGGPAHLLHLMQTKKSQGELNFEQQGEVLADYYRLLCKKERQSTSTTDYLISIYEYVINQWRRKEIYRW